MEITRDQIATELTDRQLELFRQLHELAESQGSIKKACGLIGPPVHDSAVSTIKSGKFIGNLDNFFSRLDEYFTVKEIAREAYKEVEYADTSFSRRVYDILRISHAKGGFSIICGDPGIGKTQAVEKYVADHQNSAFTFTMNECYSSLKEFTSLFVQSVGLTPTKSCGANCSLLKDKIPDGTIVIIDEAQDLSMRLINMMYKIPDEYKKQRKTLSIVLVGNSYTSSKFGRESSVIEQFKSRIRYDKYFKSSNAERSDITKLFPFLLPGENDREIDFLLHISRGKFGFRDAVNIVSNAHDADNLTYEGLIASAKDLGVCI